MIAKSSSPSKFRLQMAAGATLMLTLLPTPSSQAMVAEVQTEATSPSYSSPVALQGVNVLYDGALNTGTPDTQGFFYLPYPTGSAQATQVFTPPVTVLDTTPQMSDFAGYFAKPTLYPPLDRVGGYQVLFTVQIVTETHICQDRAGFSLLVVSSDKRGIELGFWADEIWAQAGGISQPFTHAEGAAFTTTNELINYKLIVLSETYTLTANDTVVLSGVLRDYTLAPPPPLPVNPYDTPKMIFLGDDTSMARAKVKLLDAAVIVAAPFNSYLPLVNNETAPPSH
jgi:hypothetical protein